MRAGRLSVGSLCTGYGGLDLGVAAAFEGTELRWCAEFDPMAGRIVAARFPHAPNLGDITAIDWRTVERVEVITAGFPCQDISCAGHGGGIEKGTRSGVWTNVMDAVRLLRPGLLVVENVAALRWRGLGRVLGDLAQAGYDARWCSVRACDIGAPHRRERVFIAACPCGTRPPRLRQPTRKGTPEGRPDTRRGEPRSLAADPDGPRRTRRAKTRPCGTPPGQPDADRPGLRRAGSDTDTARAAGRRRRNGGTERGDRALAVAGAASDAEGERCDQRQPEPARLQGRSDATVGGHQDQQPDTTICWGPYEAAITRWEEVLDRPAPEPTEPGRGGRPRLSPRFVEWMMGLPEGWVTELDLPRTAQLRALGNGVIPAQATHALDLLALFHANAPGPEDQSRYGRER